jgi:3-deoxy-manno-octulosonate cytidylyltransferase (CMP-KDO synthetase)
MARTVIVVPCRLESTRFPRKLLHKIQGKPLLLWVAERIRREAPDIPLYFAVDDILLSDCLVPAGFEVIMTRADHTSGTDRLAEANGRLAADHVINVQADEPLVSGRQIRRLAELIEGSAAMATLATRFLRAADFANPNQVKVVCAADGRALYFTRSPVPYDREGQGQVDDAWLAANPCFRHLGLYAYKAALLARFSRLPPGRLEQLEKLEQLRVLENGEVIAVGITDEPTIGVDTLADAEEFGRRLAAAGP